MTLKEALKFSTEYLEEKNIDEADFKALCIVCSAAGITNSKFFSSTEEVDLNEILPLLKRIENREPLQYVLGKWDFYESEFFVGEGVLIPRPETEELVELAIKEAEKFTSPVIYDLCAGSGCIGISVAKKLESSTVFCIEKSEQAFEYLKQNAKGIDNVNIFIADICDDIDLPKADIIISNPPYIKTDDINSLEKELFFEPRMALDGGQDGLDFYRIIKDKYTSKLNDCGVFLFEIGNEQGNDIISLFGDAEIIKDIYGNDRIARIIKE